jgi:hypothetical protein
MPADRGYYNDDAFRMKWHDFFVGKIPKQFTAYYEIVGYVSPGKPIMSDGNNNKLKDKAIISKYGERMRFSYGCADGENDIYVYRMTATTVDGEVIEIPWDAMVAYCDEMGVKHVPELDRFEFSTIEDMKGRISKWIDMPDPIGISHVAEGVVVRITNKRRFTAFKEKGFIFKQLEGLIKDEAETPDLEESQELGEEYAANASQTRLIQRT